MLSQDDMRNVLRHRCEAAGGSTKWAKANGVSDALVSYVLTGKQEVGDKLASAMGYERRVCFFPLRRDNNGV